MEYRVLGKTGLKISRLGLGGIPIQKIDAEGTKPLLCKLLQAGRAFDHKVRREEYRLYLYETSGRWRN